MSVGESRGWGKIHKYWLPFESPPMLDSIAIDRDDVWFYTRWLRLQGLGQIKLKDSEAEFNHYILSGGDKDSLIIEQGIYRFQESRRGIGPGIAAHDGYVWYGEREGIIRMKWSGPGSGEGRLVSEKQALCKMHTKTHRATRYLFPPDKVSLNQLAYRLELDPSSRRVWGATNGLSAWVFDTATNMLKVLTIGKIVERNFKGHIVKVKEHSLRDVVIEPNEERGWFIDNSEALYRYGVHNEALYLFDVEDGSLLKYPLIGFHPRAVDLAPDGKIWCTSVTPASLPVQNLDLPTINIGYILCLDPNTNELTTYLVPHGFLRPGGILVTDEGEVWFAFSRGRYFESGISKLNPEQVKGKTTVITPEEPEDWGIAEYDVTEAEGEEIRPNTFELHPDQPIKREYWYEYQPSFHGGGFVIYSIRRTPNAVRDLAQDSQGRIWFTTREGGHLGVLMPLQFA